MIDYNEDFWNALDELVNTSEIVIDRPKGSAHPRFPSFIYRVDYGYLRDTTSMDGSGIDVWVGSGKKTVDAVMCIVDLMKRDSEIKILIGCTEEEKICVPRNSRLMDFRWSSVAFLDMVPSPLYFLAMTVSHGLEGWRSFSTSANPAARSAASSSCAV